MASRKPSLHADHAAAFDTDVTYRRLMHELRMRREQLAAQHERFVAASRRTQLSDIEATELFDLLPVPTFLLDSHGNVRRANAAGAELLGIHRSRLADASLLVFVPHALRRSFLDHMRHCRQGPGLVTTEIALRTGAGAEIPLQLASRELGAHPSGTERTFLTTALDLRERRRLEAERRRAVEERRRLEHERARARATNETKDRFLAMLSHELRAPLTPVLLTTSTWKDAASVPEPVRHVLTMIHRNATAEARLIDDLLDLTRISQDKLRLDVQVVDLHATVDEVVDSLAAEAGTAEVTLALALEARGNVCADPLRLRQVVTNLVRNAIAFTPPGGRVTVRTHDGFRGFTTLAVSDTGIGFDAATHARMFEPFEQGPRPDRGGLGLGLAICKGLVEAQGGTIAAFSDGVGRGARLVIDLPATAAGPEPIVDGDAKAGAGCVAPRGGLTILLVEDHHDTGLALSYVLERAGYRVELAHTVTAALAAATATDIDVVVSDLGLPDGSGFDLVRALNARKPIRSIALTGYGQPNDVADTREAGFDRHLTKPVDVATLIAAIESLRGHAA